MNKLKLRVCDVACVADYGAELKNALHQGCGELYISYLIHVAVILCGAQESGLYSDKGRCDGIFCESPRQTEKQQSLSLLKDYGIVIIDCAGCGVFDL